MTSDEHRNVSNNSRTDCEELRDLLPAYSIGATTEEEKSRVELLLALCPEVAAELPQYLGITEGFLQDVEAIEPPVRVKAGLMARLAAEESSNPAMPANIRILEQPSEPSRKLNAWWLVAAASIALIISNVFWFLQFQGLGNELSLLQAQEENLLALLSDSSSEQLVLQASDSDEAVALVFWNDSSNEATLYSNNLPILPEGLTYQLWLIEGDVPVSVGLFQVDTRGYSVYNFQGELKDYETLGISVEPEAGSEAPTTDPIAVGAINL